MKRDIKSDLACRYAQAWLHVFGPSIQYKECIALKAASRFIRSDRRITAFLKMPIIDDSVKIQAFDRVLSAYELPVCLKPLFVMLLEHKRTCLLSTVFIAIARLYLKSAGIELFTISSAYLLSQEQQNLCEAFLSHTTHKKIIAQYVQDESLIAGIRMQSNGMLWEHSIKKQLRELRYYFCPVGEDYES